MQSLLWKLARKYILATVVDGNVEDYPRWDHVEYATYKVLKWIKYLVFCVKLSICNLLPLTYYNSYKYTDRTGLKLEHLLLLRVTCLLDASYNCHK